MPGHSGPWRKICWLIRERVLCLEQPACNAASMPLCSLGLSVLHVKHVGQRCHYCRPELPWTHVTRRTCGVKKTHTQPCTGPNHVGPAGQARVQGNSSARDGQATSPVLTAQRPPLPQPPGGPKQGRPRDIIPGSGPPSVFRTRFSTRLGVIRGLLFTSISTAFSHGFMGPRVPCAARARHREKNLLTLRPASPAPATTAQAGALARRDSSAPPHMHCWSSSAGGSTARLDRALQLRQKGSARSFVSGAFARLPAPHLGRRLLPARTAGRLAGGATSRTRAPMPGPACTPRAPYARPASSQTHAMHHDAQRPQPLRSPGVRTASLPVLAPGSPHRPR